LTVSIDQGRNSSTVEVRYQQLGYPLCVQSIFGQISSMDGQKIYLFFTT